MKALITLLLLGTSSAALAHPGHTEDNIRDHRTNTLPYVEPSTIRDHRTPVAPQPQVVAPQPIQIAPQHTTAPGFDPMTSYRMRARMSRPVTLADDVSFMRTSIRDQRPLRINIDQRNGSFKKLRLDRSTGRMFIDAVVITFADGHKQNVDLNQTLSNQLPSLTIDLDHGGAMRIDIYGTSHRGRATFDVIGLRR